MMVLKLIYGHQIKQAIACSNINLDIRSVGLFQNQSRASYLYPALLHTYRKNGKKIPLSVNHTTVKNEPLDKIITCVYPPMSICLAVQRITRLPLLLHCSLSNAFSIFHSTPSSKNIFFVVFISYFLPQINFLNDFQTFHLGENPRTHTNASNNKNAHTSINNHFFRIFKNGIETFR